MANTVTINKELRNPKIQGANVCDNWGRHDVQMVTSNNATKSGGKCDCNLGISYKASSRITIKYAEELYANVS